MKLKCVNITADSLRKAIIENKLLLRNDGTLWIIVQDFIDPEGCPRVMVQSANELHRISNAIEYIAQEFKVVESINLFNNSHYNLDDFCSTNYTKVNVKHNIETKEIEMEQFVENMIQEHKELFARIGKLHAWVHGDAYEQVDAREFANECIQLKAMKTYEEALRARLFNAGINFVNGEYLVAVDNINDEPEDGDSPDND